MNPYNNISPELLETVERYLNQTMPLDERQTFENRLATDTDLKTRVEEIKTLILGIETQALKEKLDQFHNEIPNADKETKVISFNYKKLLVAASVVIALGMFWYYGENSNTKLYNKYYSQDPGLPTTMGTQDNYEFYNAMVSYKRKEYDTAISKWESLLLKKPENDTLNYFIGSAYLAKEKENKAISYLAKATEFKQSIFINEAYYYLGLAYLKTNQVELAKTSFKQSNMSSSKNLLKELED